MALILGVAAFASNWAFARLVRGQVDAALVDRANTEAAAISADPNQPIRIHEAAPGTTRPSFVRLHKLNYTVTREVDAGRA